VKSIALVAALATQDVALEYIGHASFRIVSPAGVRIVIDPFNSDRWLGYRFPEGAEADAVLVTHPHYDHDASYYFSESVPVFREPGRYRVSDVELTGIAGRHADPYGKDFEQKNTIWLIDTGSVRVAHLGDNGPLTEENVRALGRVDVLLIPVDGDDHILKRSEIAEIRRELLDPLVVPMHYRLDGLLGLPRSLGPIDPWLQNEPGVVRLESNRSSVSATRDPNRKVLVFRPSPDLAPWPMDLARAFEDLEQAQQIAANYPTQLSQAQALVGRAYQTSDSIVFSFHWAEALAQSGRSEEAIGVIEKSLSHAARADWQYRMQAHSLLAELYEKAGQLGLAAEHHRIVLQGSYRTALKDKARRFLER
jgi:L-ascorbate metabolism protein UlaG (beta-lactamase superfamily)